MFLEIYTSILVLIIGIYTEIELFIGYGITLSVVISMLEPRRLPLLSLHTGIFLAGNVLYRGLCLAKVKSTQESKLIS